MENSREKPGTTKGLVMTSSYNRLQDALQQDEGPKLKLAFKLRPIVYLDEKEKYFPCTVQYFMKNSSLWDAGHKECKCREGRVRASNLPVGPQYTQWELDVDPESWSGCNPDHLNRIPYYVRVKKKGSLWIINYVFLYTYNGAYYPCWCSCLENVKCCHAGEHQADVEHVTYEVNLQGEIQRIYFSAHGHRDGEWKNIDDVETYKGRPIVYSGRHGHPSYPRSGTICRCLGLFSDKTSKGYCWDPANISIITDETHWNMFPGYLGTSDHVPTPMHHGFWEEETQTSTNWFCRFFCICW